MKRRFAHLQGLWIGVDRDRENDMTLARKLDGVGQQIEEDLLQSIRISFKDETVADERIEIEMESDG